MSNNQQPAVNIEGTAYQMIADVLGLERDGNAWKDPRTNERFVWTKYGFQYAVIETNKIQERRCIREKDRRISALIQEKLDLEHLIRERKKQHKESCERFYFHGVTDAGDTSLSGSYDENFERLYAEHLKPVEP